LSSIAVVFLLPTLFSDTLPGLEMEREREREREKGEKERGK
jgi:hypothetical protein